MKYFNNLWCNGATGVPEGQAKKKKDKYMYMVYIIYINMINNGLKLPKFGENINIHIHEVQKIQKKRLVCRKPHLGTQSQTDENQK